MVEHWKLVGGGVKLKNKYVYRGVIYKAYADLPSLMHFA